MSEVGVGDRIRDAVIFGLMIGIGSFVGTVLARVFLQGVCP